MFIVGVVGNEFPLRAKLAQIGQEVIPVRSVRPNLQTCVLDLGIQNGRNVKQGYVFDIDKDG